MKKKRSIPNVCQRAVALLLVFAMLVTLAPIGTGVQAAEPQTTQTDGGTDSSADMLPENGTQTGTEQEQGNTPQSESPEGTDQEGTDQESTGQENIDQTETGGGTDDESSDQTEQTTDWSARKEVRYSIVDLKKAGEKDAENENEYQLTMNLFWEKLSEEERVQEGDTLSFKVPEELFLIEDTQTEDTQNPDQEDTEEDSAIPVYTGDIKEIEKKDAEIGNDPVAEYEIKDQEVKLVFLKNIEEIDDITSVFTRLELPVQCQPSVLEAGDEEIEWIIQTYEDETEQKLTFKLSPEDKAEEENASEADEKDQAAQQEEEQTEQENAIAEGDSDTVNLGGIEIAVTGKNQSELSQDVYWIDNNSVPDRLSADDYLKFYRANAKVKVTIKVGEDKPKEVEMTVAELEKALGMTGTGTENSILTCVNRGGTGHYELNIESGMLPVAGTSASDDDPETADEITLEWELLPPTAAPEQYYYVNEEAEEGEELDVPEGWYYIKTQDFTVEFIQRRGDTTNLNGLQKAVLNGFSFYWKANRTDTDEQSITLQELQDHNNGLDVTIDGSEPGPNGEFNVYTLTISNLPIYRVDGTESLFYITRRDEEGNNNDIITGIKEGTDDYMKITYENDEVANVGTEVDRVYSGGDVILTLTGETDYDGEKVWGDAGYEEANRPDLKFQLWRYTKKDGESYRHASPVKNSQGDIVVLNVDGEDYKGDSFTIDFHNHDKLPTGGKDNVLLTDKDGKEETLPKYDPEGYEYIYFARETVEPTAGADSYKKLYGEIVQNEDGTLSLKDTLPEGVDRDTADTSIYNGGAIVNQINETVTTKVEKTWAAAAYQDAFQDVRVEMTLQSRVKGSEVWGNVQKNGTTVTVNLEGFTAEQLTQMSETSADKYNYRGEELEYRWVETGVYQGKNSTDNLLDTKNMSFTLNQSGNAVGYVSESGTTVLEDKTFMTPITNRMSDKVNYEVEKQWGDAEGNILETAPEGATASIQLYQQNYKTEIRAIGPEIKLDGIADDEVSEFKIDVPGNSDGETKEITVQYQEKEPWKLSITGLPKYGFEGHEYTYFAMEVESFENYVPRYTTELVGGTYYTKILNAPGSGQEIYVKKQWLDDGDAQHRGKVRFTVYNRTGENQFEPVEGAGEVVLTSADFWWKEVGIPDSIDKKNILVLETAVTSAESDEWIPITHTPEEMERIYQELQSQEAAEDTYRQNFETEEHMYLQRYSIMDIAGNDFYTVTNQRLGIIDLTVTKEWRDGEGGTRADFLKILEEENASLGIRLISTDVEDAIDYDGSTVDIGDGPYEIQKPGAEDPTKPEKAAAVQTIDVEQQSSNYYFYNLPKYTPLGEVVHYSVEEVVIYEDGKIEDFQTFKAAYNQGQSDENKIIYSSSMKADDYVTGEKHTHDTQSFEIRNTLSGTKDVVFHKLWLDDYRNNLGERPDLSLDIYQLGYNDEDTKGDEKTLQSLYRDYVWSKSELPDDVDGWDITISGLPKYDKWGYEITYYAKENVNIDREAFDYEMPIYRYKTGSGNASADYSDVGTETGGPASGYEGEDYVIPLDDGSGVHLLKEDGVFVNQIKEDVIFSGKKIWQLIPSGYVQAALPEVTFELWRLEDTGDSTKTGTEDDEKPADEKIAWVDVLDWKNQWLDDGSYQFGMKYLGKNLNTVTSEGLEITSATEGAGTIPQYDENGKLYNYEVREVITLKDGTKVEEVFDSTIAGGSVYNTYKKSLGNLTVKKIVDLGRELESGEKYPTVSFTLKRYYEDAIGMLIKDDAFSMVQEIPYTDFVKSDEDEKIATAKVTFDDLLIYAPNGSKYKYVVDEDTGVLKGGYVVTVGKGDRDSPDVTIPYTQAFDITGEADKGWILEAEKDSDETPDITFKNTRKSDTVQLKGNKIWEDKNDEQGLRPKLEDDAIKLTVYRYADAQSGGNSILSHVVPDDEYSINWNYTDDENTWEYEIIGKETTGELERYAPNGQAWKYRVVEELAEPWSSYYHYVNKQASQGNTQPDEDGNISLPALKNSLLDKQTAIKKWSLGTTSSGLPEDYLGYKMQVTFELQARVDSVSTKGKSDEKISNWISAKDLLTGISNQDIKTLFPAEGLTEKSSGIMEIKGNVNSWWKCEFDQLLTGVRADKGYSIASGTEDSATIKISEGDIVGIKYRIVEKQINYYQSTDSNILIFTQNYTASAKPTFVDEEEQPPTYEIDPKDGIFTYVTSKEDASGLYIRNGLDTVSLRVYKIWKNDAHNAYETRPGENGTSTVSFVIQRRAKAETAGTENDWEIVKTYKDGTAKDLVTSINIEDTSNIAGVTVPSLPRYGFDTTSNPVKRVEYEYRARELAAGYIMTGNEVDPNAILSENASFNLAYEVKYASSSENKGEVWSEVLEEIRAELGEDIPMGNFAAAATNTMRTKEIYARKAWKDTDVTDLDSYPEVTFKLQYLKEIEDEDSGEKKDVWTDFEPAAEVVLNGVADNVEGKDPAYYECEAWTAKWQYVPVAKPGSKLNAAGETQYRVVEVTNNTYPVDAESESLSGSGTKDDPFVYTYAFDFTSKGNGSETAPYTITDERTRIKITKSAETGGVEEEFKFTIRPENVSGAVLAYYQKYIPDKDSETGYIKGEKGKLDMSQGQTVKFTLKDGEYIIIYNLVKNAKYTIAETGVTGVKDTDKPLEGYETTCDGTAILNVSPPEGSTNPDTDRKYNITIPSEAPASGEDIPQVNFTNKLKGQITIEKKDENGKALADVVFQLKWREKNSPEGTEYKELDASVCSNEALVTGIPVDEDGVNVPGTVKTDKNGKAVFDGLYLGKAGCEYQITELKTAGEHNLLLEPIEGITLPYATTAKSNTTDPWRVDGSTYYYREITITVENNKVVTMPVTSGSGFFLPGVIGMIAVFAGGGYYIWQEEKKRGKKQRHRKAMPKR